MIPYCRNLDKANTCSGRRSSTLRGFHRSLESARRSQAFATAGYLAPRLPCPPHIFHSTFKCDQAFHKVSPPSDHTSSTHCSKAPSAHNPTPEELQPCLARPLQSGSTWARPVSCMTGVGSLLSAQRAHYRGQAAPAPAGRAAAASCGRRRASAALQLYIRNCSHADPIVQCAALSLSLDSCSAGCAARRAAPAVPRPPAPAPRKLPSPPPPQHSDGPIPPIL
jgi:hypothetical protein